MALALLAVVAGTIAAALFLGNQTPPTHLVKNGLYFPAALAIVWLCAAAPRSVSIWNRTWAARLGASALPIFLLHVPLFQLYTKVEKLVHAVVLDDFPTLSALISYSARLDLMVLAYPLYFIPVIVLALLTQEHLTGPLQTWLRQKLNPAPPAAEPAPAAPVTAAMR